MIRVILFALFVAAFVMAAVWFANDPGNVSVVWRGWRLDTSVGILLLLIAGVTLGVLGLAKIVAMISGTAKAFAAQRKDRRITQGLKTLAYGMAAAHAGQGQAARKYAKEAAALLDDIPATQLLTARAAMVNSDGGALRTVAVHLLDRPETELSALRDLATQALQDGDVVGALNFAKRALGRKDAPPWATEMVLDVLITSGRWSEALSTLESKAIRANYKVEDYKILHTTLLTHAAEEALSQNDPDTAERLSRKALDTGTDARAVAFHARALILQGKGKKAAGEIEKAWETHANAALAHIYLEAGGASSALEHARRIERLISRAPDHPESRLALADASLKAQLWGQARNRIAPLLGDDVPAALHARAALLMSELETGERNDAIAGATWLKRALEKTSVPDASASSHAPRSVKEVLARHAT